MEPIILDNVLPASFVAELEHTLTSIEFDWHCNPTISYGTSGRSNEFVQNDINIVETRAFVHRFYYENKKASTYCDFVRPILYFIENRIPVNSIQRIRAVLAPKESEHSGKYNTPHIDLTIPHKTLIYYVNDSDGCTILFNEKYNGSYDPSKKTIAHEIQAKRGRIVIFDGLQYHTGKIPVSSDKILININFT
jgi:hypothetical protein